MDAVNKNGNSAVDDVSGGKETTGNNCDENGTGATAGDQKENGVNTGAISNVTANSNTSSGEGELHHHGADRLDTSSAAGGATVKRSHSTDEDDDSKKKRRKDDGSRGEWNRSVIYLLLLSINSLARIQESGETLGQSLSNFVAELIF